MDKLILLVWIGMVHLCDAGRIQYNNNGFVISDSSESEEGSCGRIMSSTGIEFKSEKHITSGGTDSKYEEFPWMVALFIPKTKYQQCALTDNYCWDFGGGGSLISPKVVLVGGYNVSMHKQEKLKVRAGDWNLDTFEERSVYQEQFVNKIIIHPYYLHAPINKGELVRYDAALLVTESPFTPAENIGFICLPPPNLNIASTSCKLAGWGLQTLMPSGNQQILQVVDLNYVDHYQCQRTLGQNWWNFVLYESLICTEGVLRKGACRGDHGSPLMCIADNHYYARGLFSWNLGCGGANLPYAYTDVVKVRSWIDQQMRANGFTTDTYTPVADTGGESSEGAVTVSVLAAARATLPCDVTARGANDTLLLVVWYREDKIIYSYDMREKGPPAHWSKRAALGARAHFTPRAPSGLQLEDTREADAGEYRCRVDFTVSRTRNYRIVLNVVECGIVVAPQGEELVINGAEPGSNSNRLPWHVGLYDKTSSQIMQICGGSIFSPKLVVTAAHCVYNDQAGLSPASTFAVAAGKIYRSWNASEDDEKYVQMIDVIQIEIPERYKGIINAYTADIAVLVLERSFVFSSFVKPVCIKFDKDYLDVQFGKMAGWGLTAEDGKASNILKTVTLPFVDFEECYNKSPNSYRPLITTDKFCAGYANGTARCKGDSGGGLVITRSNGYQNLHYLYGIVSTSPPIEAPTSCSEVAYIGFTNLKTHEEWFQNIWSIHNTIN